MSQEARNLQRIPVLTEAECIEAAARVNSLRERWIPRDAAGLHTLGAALYLDAAKPETVEALGGDLPRSGQYQERLEPLNKLLKEHFGWAHEKVSAALSEWLRQEVRYCHDRALPGFHVFESNPLYERLASHVPHFDRQQECLPWEEEDVDFAKALSFTLPVRLPQTGGGIRIWNVDLYDVLQLGKEKAKELIRSEAPRFHAYQLGELAVHPGRLLHQIAPWTFRPGEQRITLQGHALWYSGRWNLYW